MWEMIGSFKLLQWGPGYCRTNQLMPDQTPVWRCLQVTTLVPVSKKYTNTVIEC